VFSGPGGDIFFLGPACMYLCWTQGFFFSDSQINCPRVRFPVFLDPCACFLDLASIGWGGNSIVIGAHIGLDPVHVFLTWHRVGGILDTETRCTQGAVPVLKQ